MKKAVLFFIISLIINSLYSQVDNDLLFFKGIGTGLGAYEDAMMMPMEEQMKHLKDVVKTNDGIIIGHSQGGLRALAFAGYSHENELDVDLNAVITIGAPLKGFSPLIQGSNVFLRNFKQATITITTALNKAAKVVNIYSKVNERQLLESMGLNNGLLEIILMENFDFSKTSLPDMTPGSSFIQDNTNSYFSKEYADRYIVEYGYKVVRTKRFPFVNVVRYIKSKKPETYMTHVLPENTKYGFIVGQDSDLLRLIGRNEEVREILPGIDLFENRIVLIGPKEVANIYVSATGAAANAYDAQAVSHDAAAKMAWLLPGIDKREEERRAALRRENAKLCREGRDWVKNFDVNYSKLLGTTPNQHDCLIPSSDQAIDLSKIDREGIDGGSGAFASLHLNHINEMSDKELWGEDGGLDKETVGDNSFLDRWLDNVKINNAAKRVGVEVK